MTGIKEEYQLSGGMGKSLPAVFIGGSITAVILGYIYGYLCVYNPLAGFISFFLVLGYGLALGAVIFAFGHESNCRNPKFMGFMGVSLGCFSLYSSWVVFLYALLKRYSEDVDDLSLLSMFVDPTMVWGMVLNVNETGWFSLRGYTPTGGVLWTFWALEALMIVGIAFFTARSEDDVFCEQCYRWSETLDPVSFLAPTNPEGQPKLDLHDLSDLNGMDRAEGGEPHTIRIKTCRCSECGLTATYQLFHDAITVDDKGKTEKTEKNLTPKYIIHQEDLEKLKAVLRPKPKSSGNEQSALS